MVDQLLWRKSSRSGNGGACVEVACTTERRLVQDSKNPGPRLEFPTSALGRLLEVLRND
jgi:hypothetical protein